MSMAYLSEDSSGFVNQLFRIGDHFITSGKRHEQLIDVVDTASTALEQVKDWGALTGGGVTEREDPVTAVCVERAENTDARVTLVTVETHRLVVMWSALDLLLNLGVEHCMSACYLHHKQANMHTRNIQGWKNLGLLEKFLGF